MVINFQTLFFTYELGNLLTFWNFHKITFESVERKDNVFHLPLYTRQRVEGTRAGGIVRPEAFIKYVIEYLSLIHI